MPVKTRINSKGIDQISGAGFTVAKDTGNKGFYPYGEASVTNVTADATISAGQAGVLVMSGDSVLTGTLPAVTSAYGLMLTVRYASAHAHALSSSQDSQDNTNITDGTSEGSKLALPAAVGSSVTLISDGVHWVTLGNTGSITISNSAT